MGTYDNPHHSNPHGQFPARLLGKNKRENASRKTSQVVYGDDDTFERGAGVVERVEKVCIADDSRENTLIVAKEYECELTGDRDSGSKAEASSIPIQVWCFYHCGRDVCRYAMRARVQACETV